MTGIAADSLAYIPPVTDADIDRAEQYLGVSFDETRREILRSNDSFDVQACPGSGKTTLLVAKLVILGEHWPYARRGICVLSHTNVAREEVANKLARTSVGKKLLTYPHFIGTIQRFVNEFLALPMLRSQGYHVRLIDDDLHAELCKALLGSELAYRKAKFYLDIKDQHDPDRTISALRYEGSELKLACAEGKLPNPKTPSGVALESIKKEVVGRGYWRFDDMFAWAERLLSKYPQVKEFVRWRFPVVFMDETQDTSELQAHVLGAIFPADGPGLRQRFGDANQAIYDFGQDKATTDGFPAPGHRSLPSSQRFGPSIATKALPLAAQRPNPSLVGEGPRRNVLPPGSLDAAAMPHTIFLFDPDTVREVLPSFGKLLLHVFPDEVLRSKAFLARAVGWVGTSRADASRVPRCLGDYWEGYDSRVTKPEVAPRHLADYIHIAQLRRAATTDCAESVAMVVKGICELIAIIRPSATPQRGYTARWLWEALRKHEPSNDLLRRLLWEWCVEAKPLVEEHWADMVKELRRALDPIVRWESDERADAFCQWSIEFAGSTSGPGTKGDASPNLYRFCQNGRYVDIDVGTIHSAKGQTHTATLVVETYFKRHDMEDLLPWICGRNCGPPSRGVKEGLERMRLIYTAMTRPSHLLCLAMRREALGKGPEEAEIRDRLEHMGWTVVNLGACEGSSP